MGNLLTKLALLLLVLAFPLGAQAHELTQGHQHVNYSNWKNRKVPTPQGCCNNQDCRPISDENVDERGAEVQVRVEGQWCPVKPHHYLSTGNAPDWTTAHVCVENKYNSSEYGETEDKRSPCERLLCYQPRPGT
jgi:hypothetical protein